jgi:hypothetical protein
MVTCGEVCSRQCRRYSIGTTSSCIIEPYNCVIVREVSMPLHSLKSAPSMSSPLVPTHPSSSRCAQSGGSLPGNASMPCMKWKYTSSLKQYSETAQYHLEHAAVSAASTEYGDYHFCHAEVSNKWYHQTRMCERKETYSTNVLRAQSSSAIVLSLGCRVSSWSENVWIQSETLIAFSGLLCWKSMMSTTCPFQLSKMFNNRMVHTGTGAASISAVDRRHRRCAEEPRLILTVRSTYIGPSVCCMAPSAGRYSVWSEQGWENLDGLLYLQHR